MREIVKQTFVSLRSRLFKYAIVQLAVYVAIVISMFGFKSVPLTLLLFIFSLLIPFFMVVDVLIRNQLTEALMNKPMFKYIIGLLIAVYTYFQYTMAGTTVNEIYAVQASSLPTTTAILSAVYFAKDIVLAFSLVVIMFSLTYVNVWVSVVLLNFEIGIGEVVVRALKGILFVFAFGFIVASPGIASMASQLFIERVAWEVDFSRKNRCTNPEVMRSPKALFLQNDMVLIPLANKNNYSMEYVEKKCHI